MRGGLRVALRADDQEAGVALAGAGADAVEQRLPEDGLVRDDENVGRAGARAGVHDDVLDGTVSGSAADLGQQITAQPARLGRWMRGHDQLVDPLPRDHVLDGVERPRVDNGAVGRDPGGLQRRDRAVEPAAGGRPARILVDDVPRGGLADRGDDDSADRPALGAEADGVDQRVARQGLVCDDEDDAGLVAHAGVSWRSDPPDRTA